MMNTRHQDGVLAHPVTIAQRVPYILSSALLVPTMRILTRLNYLTASHATMATMERPQVCQLPRALVNARPVSTATIRAKDCL